MSKNSSTSNELSLNDVRLQANASIKVSKREMRNQLFLNANRGARGHSQWCQTREHLQCFTGWSAFDFNRSKVRLIIRIEVIGG